MLEQLLMEKQQQGHQQVQQIELLKVPQEIRQVKAQAIRQVVVHKIQVLVMGQIRQVKVKHRLVQLRKIKQILMGKIRIKLLQ